MTVELRQVLNELKTHEPLYHRREWVASDADFEREVHPEFWEVGASGTVYSREFVKQIVLQRLATDQADMSVTQAWSTSDHAVRHLGGDTYLFTYLLDEGTQNRVTRRSTIWERGPEGWRAVYHQGTVVTQGASA